MVSGLSCDNWSDLLQYIEDDKCTPFLGAGASIGNLPSASDIAETWALRCRYPLVDKSNLSSVAQYIACTDDNPERPKLMMANICKTATFPDFAASTQIHGILADLPLSIYLTTNYDDFMCQGLRTRTKHPYLELCPWNSEVRQRWPSPYANKKYIPSVANPTVYHLHGHQTMPESMVLTDNDYLRFLVWMAKDAGNTNPKVPETFPWAIRNAMTNCMLFIGYSFKDWTFKVLLRSIIEAVDADRSQGKLNVAVQLEPRSEVRDDADSLQRVKTYFARYQAAVHRINMTVYWGDVNAFARDLRAKWCERKQHHWTTPLTIGSHNDRHVE